MAFQLPDVTECICTNANPRTEIHGKDENGKERRVRAIDLTFQFTTENTVLNAIAPGLREHFYRNKAADAAQETLPDVVIPLPNIRFPQLKTDDIRWEQPKSRGYRWIWDWGREAQHVDFSDVAVGGLALTLHEGGTTDVKFSVSYNGADLEDNTLYGELCGLAAMGKVHIQLLAPAELVPAKKGWRSGKADEPEKTDGGAPLLDAGPGDDDHDDDDTGDQPLAEAADFAREVEKQYKRGRGKRAAAPAH